MQGIFELNCPSTEQIKRQLSRKQWDYLSPTEWVEIPLLGIDLHM